MQLVSEEEIASFHNDGAVLLKQRLDSRWNDLLEVGLEEAQAQPDGMSAGVGMALRIDQWPSRQSPQLKRLLDESPIAEIVGTVLDAPVRFYMDQMFYKPAGPIFPSVAATAPMDVSRSLPRADITPMEITAMIP